MLTPEIEKTEDGSQTLRHPINGQTYHSVRGARGESLHVFINNGLLYKIESSSDLQERLRILEVGLGSGLNCWLTALKAVERGVQVEYHAVELHPVAKEVWGAMDYARDPLFCAINAAQWEEMVEIDPCFSVRKIESDIAAAHFDTTFELIYMDAFSADIQPKLWSGDMFCRLYDSTSPGGALVTYSARGDVKKALREAGYRVERLEGALGKRHMLRAVKDL